MDPERYETAQDILRGKQADLPHVAEDHRFPGESIALPSVARPSGPLPDPWLCVPTSRWVCPCREGVSALDRASCENRDRPDKSSSCWNLPRRDVQGCSSLGQ